MVQCRKKYEIGTVLGHYNLISLKFGWSFCLEMLRSLHIGTQYNNYFDNISRM